jgi:hypothetical protein
MISIDAHRFQGDTTKIKVDRFPDTCSLCHRGIDARFSDLANFIAGANGRLELIFQCPLENCQSFFIARYFKNSFSGDYFQYSYSVPRERLGHEFAESIKTISPSFCAIANEAMNAEHRGWKLIAGPGFRKALEFLVKDYLCRLHPAESEKIKGMALAACIANYVDHVKLKAMAARAAWLGNDETHYVRKWEDKDLSDLKIIIELTVHWIEMAEMTDSVLTDMPEGKK